MTNTRLVSGALVIILAFLMIVLIAEHDWPVADPDDTASEDLGEILFGTSTNPGFSPLLLMLALLVISALLGAIFLAKEEEKR